MFKPCAIKKVSTFAETLTGGLVTRIGLLTSAENQLFKHFVDFFVDFEPKDLHFLTEVYSSKLHP